MTPLFFGISDNRLFGAYHSPAKSSSKEVRAVIICPPIGQEYIRSHWSLRILANQLARRGVHVLRFDYRGVGDSSNSTRDISSLDTWTEDIRDATEQLRELSGAETVLGLGLRFGGTLLAKMCNDESGASMLNSVLLWEPIVNGADYLRSQRRLHADMLSSRVTKMVTPDDSFTEEIVGTRYQKSLLNEIKKIRIDLRNFQVPNLIVDCEFPLDQGPTELTKTLELERDGMRRSEWDDLELLESAWLKTKTIREIVDQVEDMFARLSKFEAMTSVGLKMLLSNSRELVSHE